MANTKIVLEQNLVKYRNLAQSNTQFGADPYCYVPTIDSDMTLILVILCTKLCNDDITA